MPKGAWPIQANTPVGQLRELVRDTDAVEFSPAQPGYRDFAVFSDSMLVMALSASGGNLLRAAGAAFMSLAAEYAMSGRSVKTDDLLLDTRNRGRDLAEIARSFYAEAEADDLKRANDFFDLAGGPAIPGRLEKAFDWWVCE